VRPDRFVAADARVADLRYVISELPRLGLRLDLTRIGMFGHSAGGSSAANAIDAGLPIRAAANLDGSVLPPASDPGRHADFTDLGLIVDAAGLDRHLFDHFGTIDPARAVAVQRAYLLAFFTETLLGRRQQLLDGPSASYPEVTFRA
jgi:dienelactone hydrolase